jgi:alanine-glyoxylate transaminase / serine-glyoxylate transaminase / serine-pyruvate transaminase
MKIPGELTPPTRILMGPGPSDVPDRVLRAMSCPTIGHLDPEFLTVLNETRDLLQFVFRTKNELTLAVSGTGSAGMETCVCNLVEPGDEVLVCVAGVFGQRMTDVAQRCGAVVHNVTVDWGRIIEPAQVAEALKEHPQIKWVGIVHAETSTGAHQPIEPISQIVHDAGAMFLVDTVTSLGGTDVRVDDWQIDACYSGTQKCLSCPPGLSPVTFSPRAVEVIDNRKTKVQSWYLDMTLVRQYWGSERLYHHTAPINMVYALREALRIIAEEGLKPRFARHRLHHEALCAGLQALGIDLLAQEGHRLPMLNAVGIPGGIDDVAVRKQLLDEFGIELGGGLGAFKGKAWRIGLMGHAATNRNVLLLLSGLERILASMGHPATGGSAVAAAEGVYTRADGG